LNAGAENELKSCIKIGSNLNTMGSGNINKWLKQVKV